MPASALLRPAAAPRAARPASGFTLLETVIAMSVLLIGSIGLLGIHRIGVRMNSDARVMTRATAIAQDLVNQIQLWNYLDPRLANATTGNDAAYADPNFTFETDTFTFDHDESELETQDAPFTWNGLPSSAVQGLGFTRYINVAEVDDVNGNGVPDAKRVAVIVRWVQNGSPRRVVLLTTVPNPGDTQ